MVDVRRLHENEVALARATFAMMGAVFDEGWRPLGDEYLAALLRRPDVWVYAALDADGQPVGGLTANQLPMTRAETTELLIYDLAVRADRQRQGIGRILVERLRRDGAAAGAGDVWVPADDDDQHALDFYRATGATGQPVTIFTYPTRPDAGA